MKLTALPVLLLLVTASLGVSCKKKEIKPGTTISGCMDTTFVDNFYNDTIFPSEYLMTYPGSEWNYDNGTTVTCDAWENVAIAVPTTSSNCVTVTKSHYILPHTSLDYPYIYGNQAIKTDSPNESMSYQLLDTIVGVYDSFSYIVGTYPDHCNIGVTYEVVEKLTSMDVLSVTFQDVIHVRKTVTVNCPHSPGMPPPNIVDYYYAKNVGLIREINDPDQSIPVTKNLLSYTIGPH